MVWILLAVIGMGLAVIGFMALSQATMGVGMIACACFLGILARLAQAEFHHRKTDKLTTDPQ
jgi:hypothetical protein